MKYWYTLSHQAKFDLWEISQYIKKDNPVAARCFLLAAKSSFEWITTFPFASPVYNAGQSNLGRLRRKITPKYKDYHIFYQINSSQISVVRVLNVARDFASLMGI